MDATIVTPTVIDGLRLPRIIQGGMGAGVSSWRLAKAVSMLGQLGVVSGTALDLILARRLQDGDLGGHCRRALAAFPFPAMARRVLERYFIPEGRKPGEPYRAVPMLGVNGPRDAYELIICGNFVEVWLAREGHNGFVGINFLEKIQLPHLPSLYGAMLAGVAAVLMGAGIPRDIPGAIDRLALHEPAEYGLRVVDAAGSETVRLAFDPHEWTERELAPLTRPAFLPIIASNALAASLVRRANGRIDGFIVEGPTAGGHNAPPRGPLVLSQKGEPIYSNRDEVDLGQLAALGLPFWVAGGTAKPEKIRAVMAAGAHGVQVGTAFAFCVESGLTTEYRHRLLAMVRSGEARVFTDPVASPTGFPFKVARVPGTVSEEDVYLQRSRICDLGYLREAYRREDGSVGFRCASEPVEVFLKKGGIKADAEGRKCLCNALMANIGMPQLRPSGYEEQPLFTCGDDLVDLGRFLPEEGLDYTAADVIRYLSQAL